MNFVFVYKVNEYFTLNIKIMFVKNIFTFILKYCIMVVA